MRKRVAPLRQQNGAISHRALAVRALFLAAGLGALSFSITGCSGTTSLLANMPNALGGLPADAPARPVADQTAYPAVHEMPPPRTAATLTPEQVRAVEAEIAFARERQKEQAKAQAPGATQPQVEER